MKSEIVNVVATAAFNQIVDLEELRKFDDVFHDSNVYSGRVAYFKTSNMQGKVSIFSSGKMISVGTKSEETAFQELEAAKDYFVKKGVHIGALYSYSQHRYSRQDRLKYPLRI